MGVQMSLLYADFISFGCILKSGKLDHMVDLFSVFSGTSILFSVVILLIFIPTSSVSVPFALHLHQHLLYFVVVILIIVFITV
jgi:hypothetical protein